MKRMKGLWVAGFALCLSLPLVEAQNVVMKKSDSQSSSKSGNLTVRAQSLYDSSEKSDADTPWMRVVYRQIDLTKEVNMPLYYPEESTEEQENLFRIIMRLLTENQIDAYEYLDGRELFTDEYKIDVKEMLDRFHVLYSEKEGSTEKNPQFVIEESDVPCNEILSYYIVEKWVFDRTVSRVRSQVEAICPVLHRMGDFGDEAVRYPMFWIKYDVLQPYIARQYIMTSSANNVQQYNFDDFFQLRMYDGEIYKTKNLKNLSLRQMYPSDSLLKVAQDSIERELRDFDKHLWVSTPEEIAKAKAEKVRREQEQVAKEKAAAGETPAAEATEPRSTRSARSGRSSRGTTETTSSRRSTSSSNTQKTKQPKVKKSKSPSSSSSSSSSAVRSVRRTRR